MNPNPDELQGPVDRCICRDVTFARMIEMHAAGMSLEQIAEETGATANCTMCKPYAKLALATGRPTMPVMHELTIERMLVDLGR